MASLSTSPNPTPADSVESPEGFLISGSCRFGLIWPMYTSFMVQSSTYDLESLRDHVLCRVDGLEIRFIGTGGRNNIDHLFHGIDVRVQYVAVLFGVRVPRFVPLYGFRGVGGNAGDLHGVQPRHGIVHGRAKSRLRCGGREY